MIVDCHTHWGRCWRARSGGDPSEWLERAAQYGITRSVVLPHHGLENAAEIPADHDALAAVRDRAGGHMLPFCTACAWEPLQAPVEIRRCLGGLGFHGIKFHPWLQGCSVNSPVMDEIATIAGEFNVPILFHDGTPPFSLPSQIALLALRHPDTRIILGHGGLFEHYREAAAAARAADNIWICLCGGHLEALRHLVGQCPQDRLLWGSDAGFSITDVHAYRISLMQQLGLGKSLFQAIHTTNPQKLLGL